MMKYEKPWAEIVNFEAESIMDNDLDIGNGFSGFDEGVEDLPIP